MLNLKYKTSLKFLAIASLLVLFSETSFSQKRNYQLDPPNEKYARDFMINGNYVAAINEYLMLLKSDSSNYIYHQNLGLCYLNTDIDKSQAIPHLEQAVKNPKTDPNSWYDLGRAYQYAYRFDDAINSFNKFIEISQGKNSNYISPERQIEICNNAKNMTQNPVNVSFENLGPTVNSPYPDYNPYVSRDESFIIFNSRRKGNVGNLEDYDGYNTSDLYTAEFMYGTWKKAKRFSNTINTSLVEEVVGMSSDGSRVFVFFDNETGRYEVFESRLLGKTYQKPVSLGPNVNYTNKLVTSTTITPDKKVLFFASDRESKESMGGLDIYMSSVLPSGAWGPAINAGDVINTEYDEDFPYLAPDGKTLYFASMGHNTMGDFDLFKTTWDRQNNTFSKPVNLGYPINTPEDNKTISFTSSGRYAYLHARRPDTQGDLDIYRVVFKDVEPVYTIISGKILSADSMTIFDNYAAKQMLMNIDTVQQNNVQPSIQKNVKKEQKTKENEAVAVYKPQIMPDLTINITVTNKKTGKVYGTYLPNKLTSKYIVILPPGDFTIKVESNFYKNHSMDISIEDRDSRELYINSNIILEAPSEDINNK